MTTTDRHSTQVSPDATQAQIADLQRQNRVLQDRLERLEQLALAGSSPVGAGAGASSDGSIDTSTPEPQSAWSRRALLLGGVGAAAAAIHVTTGASPAAAAAGDAVLQGRVNNAGDSITSLRSGSSASTLLVTSTSAATASLLALNPGPGGSAINGVHASDGDGVLGTSSNGNGVRGTVVRGIGVYGEATDEDDSVGVKGLSPDTGVYGEGGRAGVVGAGVRSGGVFFSPEGATVSLQPGDLETLVPDGNWSPGDVVTTTSGEIWLCTGNGAGDWRLLGSPLSAGAYVPLTPTRVYDSRRPEPDGNSILVGGTSRVIDVGFARDPETGAVLSRLVPLGTRAIAANVTITGTTRTGYVALTPGVAQSFNGSSINWSTPLTTIANGLILTTDTLVQLKAWTVGGNTQLIIDVMGYYAQA